MQRHNSPQRPRSWLEISREDDCFEDIRIPRGVPHGRVQLQNSPRTCPNDSCILGGQWSQNGYEWSSQERDVQCLLFGTRRSSRTQRWNDKKPPPPKAQHANRCVPGCQVRHVSIVRSFAERNRTRSLLSVCDGMIYLHVVRVKPTIATK